MSKIFIHSINHINNISKVITFGIVIFYTLQTFSSNYYEILFIDERILIDDIYNVWLLDDVFNRFGNISNENLKNLMILVTEASYGGDLRYGRLWSNFFTLIVGPFTILGDSAVITFTRIINSLLFFFGNYLLAKALLNKDRIWIGLLIIYSLPAVEYLHRVPKPDTFLLIFVAWGVMKFKNKKYYLSIFYFSIATFIKINTVLILAVISIYVFFITTENKFKFCGKAFLVVFSGLILVNPILLIPPITFVGISTPNFYKIYLNWLTTQGTHGGQIAAKADNVAAWLNTLGEFYLVQEYASPIILLLLSVLIFTTLKSALLSKDTISVLLFITSFIYIIFYFLLIERQFIQYISLPFSLIIFSFLRTISLPKTVRHLSVTLFVAVVVSIGIYSNVERHLAEKTFNANSRYGYENIYTEKDAIDLVNKVVDKISILYANNENLKKGIVAWHPDLFIPRNKVTYQKSFQVREYWGSKDSPIEALEDYDVFVTYTNYQVDSYIEKIQIENIYIFYKTD